MKIYEVRIGYYKEGRNHSIKHLVVAKNILDVPTQMDKCNKYVVSLIKDIKLIGEVYNGR